VAVGLAWPRTSGADGVCRRPAVLDESTGLAEQDREFSATMGGPRCRSRAAAHKRHAKAGTPWRVFGKGLVRAGPR